MTDAEYADLREDVEAALKRLEDERHPTHLHVLRERLEQAELLEPVADGVAGYVVAENVIVPTGGGGIIILNGG